MSEFLARLTEQIKATTPCCLTLTKGKKTLGYGHLLQRGITEATAQFILHEDIAAVCTYLDQTYPTWRDCPLDDQLTLALETFVTPPLPPP